MKETKKRKTLAIPVDDRFGPRIGPGADLGQASVVLDPRLPVPFVPKEREPQGQQHGAACSS